MSFTLFFINNLQGLLFVEMIIKRMIHDSFFCIFSLFSVRKIINLTIENQAAVKTVQNVIGYLKGKTNPGTYVHKMLVNEYTSAKT